MPASLTGVGSQAENAADVNTYTHTHTQKIEIEHQRPRCNRSEILCCAGGEVASVKRLRLTSQMPAALVHCSHCARHASAFSSIVSSSLPETVVRAVMSAAWLVVERYR